MHCRTDRYRNGAVVDHICQKTRQFCTLEDCEKCQAAGGQPPMPPPEPGEMPPILQEAWNVAKAFAYFAADGFRLTKPDVVKERLEICDGCDARVGQRCKECGCFIILKARGRVMECDLKLWKR